MNDIVDFAFRIAQDCVLIVLTIIFAWAAAPTIHFLTS